MEGEAFFLACPPIYLVVVGQLLVIAFLVYLLRHQHSGGTGSLKQKNDSYDKNRKASKDSDEDEEEHVIRFLPDSKVYHTYAGCVAVKGKAVEKRRLCKQCLQHYSCKSR